MRTDNLPHKLTQSEIDEISVCTCCGQKLPAEVLKIKIEQHEGAKLHEQLRKQAEKLQAAELEKIHGKITAWKPSILVLVWTGLATVICLILSPQDLFSRPLGRDDMYQLYDAVVASGKVWLLLVFATSIIWMLHVFYSIHKLDKSFRKEHPTLVRHMADWLTVEPASDQPSLG